MPHRRERPRGLGFHRRQAVEGTRSSRPRRALLCHGASRWTRPASSRPRRGVAEGLRTTRAGRSSDAERVQPSHGRSDLGKRHRFGARRAALARRADLGGAAGRSLCAFVRQAAQGWNPPSLTRDAFAWCRRGEIVGRVALGETAAHRVFRGARRATDGNHSSRDRPSRPGPPIRFARIVGGDGRRRPGVAARPRQPDRRFAPKGGGWREARAAQGPRLVPASIRAAVFLVALPRPTTLPRGRPEGCEPGVASRGDGPRPAVAQVRPTLLPSSE